MTSSEKMAQMIEFVRRDRGQLGSFLKPLLILPGIRGQVRKLLQMPSDELDELIGRTTALLQTLQSDPIEQESDHDKDSDSDRAPAHVDG